MRPKRSRKGRLAIVGGVLLIAVALLLTGRNFWEAERARQTSTSVLSRLEEFLPEASASDAPFARAQTELAGGEVRQPDYVLNPDMAMPSRIIDGIAYIAALEIPALGLELPVADDWDYEKLRSAPCRYAGSAYRDTLVIAGHNYAAHFGSLYKLAAGDAVVLSDMDGNVFRYEVAEILTLEATAVQAMRESEYDLTLFTCTSDGFARVAVRCLRAGR